VYVSSVAAPGDDDSGDHHGNQKAHNALEGGAHCVG